MLTMLIALPALWLLAAPAFGQQTYVTQFDAFSGFAFLDTPSLSLTAVSYTHLDVYKRQGVC